MTGHDRLADVVYVAFRLTCHQFPHRSWFLGGRAATHDWETVRDYLGAGPGDLLAAFHNPVRDPVLGYQVAFCQRDTAVFGGLFLSVVAYAVVRRFRRVAALPFRVYLLALVPVAVDGLTQIVGLRESTPLIRTVTGALFGTATAWLVVPQVDEAFGELVHAAGAPPRGDQRE